MDTRHDSAWRSLFFTFLAALSSLALACGPGAPDSAERARFAELADSLVAGWFQYAPATGVYLGLHQYDGQLPDVTPQGFARAQNFAKRAIANLEAVEDARLSVRQQVERETLLVAFRSVLFRLDELRAPWRDPRYYLGSLALTNYVSRDYAPLSQRARAVAALAKAAPGYLQQANANLAPALPRPWLETAISQARGAVRFVRDDVPPLLSPIEDEKLRAELRGALAGMAAALETYAEALAARLPAAGDDFALGEERFLRMLRETQGIEIGLAQLEEIFAADLARNQAALAAAAAALDPQASVAEVVARVLAEKPAAGEVLALATRQSEAMREAVLRLELASIPSDDEVEVVETPPFMRYNSAFLSAAGPFEKKPLPSFYYISPPDPSWSEADQRAYLPGEKDLLFTSVHETWPGHFLQSLHEKRIESRALRAFGTTATSEGWAHYAEELMWEAGVWDDPAVHIGQLLNALLRNARCLSAIGLHVRGMTVAESEQLFRDVAFLDPGNAQQQAYRGTFDPMYLIYTLGKLAIQKMRADWRAHVEADGGSYRHRDFHDTMLSYSAAPLPAIRRALLGPEAGPLL